MRQAPGQEEMGNIMYNKADIDSAWQVYKDVWQAQNEVYNEACCSAERAYDEACRSAKRARTEATDLAGRTYEKAIRSAELVRNEALDSAKRARNEATDPAWQVYSEVYHAYDEAIASPLTPVVRHGPGLTARVSWLVEDT